MIEKPVDLARLLDRAERAERACRTLGGIVDRQAVDICRIANVPMPEDGDADFELAWSRAFEMAERLAAAERERDELAAKDEGTR